VWMTGE